MNKGEKTKQRIIEQARALFSKTGYDATKTSAIAKACGISEAAMYKYFSSKKELLEASVVIDFASEPSVAADFSQFGNEQLVEYYINRLITTIQENMELWELAARKHRICGKHSGCFFASKFSFLKSIIWYY